MALDWCRNFVYAQYLVDQLMHFDNILLMHWYWQNVGKDSYNLFFVSFQLSYGPWLMSEFYFHLISWEQIDGFGWNFVYALLWLTLEIFPNLSTELRPLIDVKISFFLNILRNKWMDFDKILFMHWYIWSMLWLIHIIFPNFQQSYDPWLILESKKISNDQELIQSDPISCPQNQKGNN